MKLKMLVAVSGLVALGALCALLFTIFGCAGFPARPSVCDAVPQDSYSAICQAAETMHATPEDVATILKLANVAALSGHVYTARQADVFIDELSAFLTAARQNGGITYGALVAAAMQRYGALPPEVQAVFIVLDGAVAVDAPAVTSLLLSDYDYGLLLGHLQQQKALLAPFLGVTK